MFKRRRKISESEIRKWKRWSAYMAWEDGIECESALYMDRKTKSYDRRVRTREVHLKKQNGLRRVYPRRRQRREPPIKHIPSRNREYGHA